MSSKGDDGKGVTESVLTRIEGFAMTQHDAGYEQGYVDAWRRSRKSGVLRSLILLLAGLALGAALLWFASNQGWVSIGDARPGDGSPERFHWAARQASEFTVTVRSYSIRDKERTYQTYGSGFIFDDQGHIVTAHHVVDEFTEFQVIWKDREYKAWLLPNSGKESDVAVLKFFAEDAKPAPLLSAEEEVMVGEELIALGSPFGFELSVTHGIVSHPKRRFADTGENDFIQTDCPLNRGNSGGPVVNLDGQVIGMASLIKTTSGDNAGVGFALAITDVREIAERIVKHSSSTELEARLEGAIARGEEIQKGVLGTLVPSSGELRILGLIPGGAAERGGVLAGDKVLAINGVEVYSMESLMRELSKRFAGDTIDVLVERTHQGRRSQKLTLSVTLGAPSPTP